MSDLKCKCGHIITDGTDNLPYKGEVISDQDWEAVWGAISELRQSSSDTCCDAITGIRIAHGRDIYECLRCGRLWVECEPGANEFVSFSPDTPVRNILRGKQA
ncbi:hypothetical protein [Nevskia ramosa]|uniref:hypothetical protein n=1 Tax=Nevskia ramosa TaxID=64002 RepID=UPI003D0DDFE3